MAIVSAGAIVDGLERRIEEAGLNNLQTRRQLFYDGWLLFLSPGRAKRARSVNAWFGSTLPVEAKIDRCREVYGRHALPLLFRITPFVQPATLDAVLEARGYRRFDDTLVQVCALDAPPAPVDVDRLSIGTLPVDAFVEAVGEARGSTASQRAAHLERLAQSPLDVRPVVARLDGDVVGGGIVSVEGDVAGLFDIFTSASVQRRGIGTAIVARLLAEGWQRGARDAYLQVNEDNAPALAVYRKFGFVTRYRYHYRAREEDVE